MPRRRGTTPPEKDAILGFEAQLWDAANALRGSMDAAEYKHVVLGLIFLKYISDKPEEEWWLLKVKCMQDGHKIMQRGSYYAYP